MGKLHPLTKNNHVLHSISKSPTPFLQNNVDILKQIVQELKNGIGILVGQTIFKLWIKAGKILFWTFDQ